MAKKENNKFTDKEKKEAFETIIDLIGEGLTLSGACNIKGMPSRITFYNWLNEEKEEGKEVLLNMYTRAREIRAERIFEEILEISDEGTTDKTNPLAVQRAKLKVDSRKWVLSKMNPKKFGDKIEHSGDPDAPIGIDIRNIKGMIVK